MNKVLISIVAAIGLIGLSVSVIAKEETISPPAVQPPAPIIQQQYYSAKDLPIPILKVGLHSMAMCTTIEAYAVRRYLRFYQTYKEDTTERGSAADHASQEAVSAYENLQVDTAIDEAIVKTLVSKGLKESDVDQAQNDITVEVGADLKKRYDDIDDFHEFEVQFKESADECTASLHSFREKIKSYFDSLKADKQAPLVK